MTKTTISRAEYLQVVGLLTLAERHYTTLRDIEAAIAGVLGDELDARGNAASGHIGDEIYGREGFSADALLRRMNIEVAQ